MLVTIDSGGLSRDYIYGVDCLLMTTWGEQKAFRTGLVCRIRAAMRVELRFFTAATGHAREAYTVS